MSLTTPTQSGVNAVSATPASTYVTASDTPPANSTVALFAYCYDTGAGSPVLVIDSGTNWANGGWSLIAKSDSSTLSFGLWTKRVGSSPSAGTITLGTGGVTCEVFGVDMVEWGDDAGIAILHPTNGIIATSTSTGITGTLPGTPTGATAGFALSIGSEVAFTAGTDFTEHTEVSAVGGFQHTHEYDLAGGDTTVDLSQDISQLWILIGYEVFGRGSPHIAGRVGIAHSGVIAGRTGGIAG